MADNKWRGDAPKVAQVKTNTVGGTIETDDLFIDTINGKSVSTSAGSTVAATVATTVAAAFNASTIPEFTEITAAATSGGALTLTADTAGVPFTETPTTTEAGGGAADAQTYTAASTTANSGPNDINLAQNWAGASTPANSENVYIENSDVDLLYSLDAFAAITPTTLNIALSFTGDIGLPAMNPLGYFEYRARYLKIKPTTLNIGYGTGQGSGRIMIDTSTTNGTVNVMGSASPAESGLYAVIWKGTGTNTVNVTRGSLDVAPFYGETAAISVLNVGYQTNASSDAQVRCSSGVTLTTINQTGGTLEINSAATTINMSGGTLTVKGSGAITTVNNRGGTFIDNGSGTITTLLAYGVVDFSQGTAAVTITNATFHPGSSFIDPLKRVTFANPFSAPGGIESLKKFVGGTNSSWQRS